MAHFCLLSHEPFNRTSGSPNRTTKYFLNSHFILFFCFVFLFCTHHNLKTWWVDWVSIMSLGYLPPPPPPPPHHPFLCHLKSTDPFNMLQHPSTKNQSQPLFTVTCKLCGFLIFRTLKVPLKKGGNNRRALRLEDFYVF